MRTLVLPGVRVNRSTLDAAFDAVFGIHMLRRVHGPSLTVGPFAHNNNTRTFKFHVDVTTEVPAVLRRFFCGKHLAVTTRQHLGITSSKWTVTNSLTLHFVGSELFTMHPLFWLETREDGGVYLGGTISHTARLPPPLNGIAEEFMKHHSEAELRRFGECLADAGVIDRVDRTT